MTLWDITGNVLVLDVHASLFTAECYVFRDHIGYFTAHFSFTEFGGRRNANVSYNILCGTSLK